MLVGYGPGEDGVDPDAYRDTVDDEVKELGALHMAQRYPAIQQAGMRRGYAGCYTMTPDGKMIVDRAPELRASILAPDSVAPVSKSHLPWASPWLSWPCTGAPPRLMSHPSGRRACGGARAALDGGIPGSSLRSSRYQQAAAPTA